MLTRIYIVRHCEAEGNACRRSQTNYEGTVTTKGFAQCEALRNRFHDEKIDAVYSSDSYRARVTADPVAKDHGLLTKYRYLLREYRVGNWDGNANGNVYEDYPEVMKHNAECPGDMWFPGGDTYKSIESRCRYILNQIAEENPGKTVVVVSHALTIRVLFAVALGLPGDRVNEIPYGDNTAVSLIEYEEGKYNVRYMSDNSHLAPELQRAWSHDNLGEINLSIHRCSLPEDWNLMKGSGLFHSADDVKKAVAEDPDSVAVFSIKGAKCGYVAVAQKAFNGVDYIAVKEYSINLPHDAAEFSLQAIGYALHLARSRNILYITVPVPSNDIEEKVVGRFEFEPVPDVPGYLRLSTLIPPCEYPVI